MVFQPMPNGRIQTLFTTSTGDGLTTIHAQFRNASGVASAQLEGGVLIDTEAPTVAWIAPTTGSLMTHRLRHWKPALRTVPASGKCSFIWTPAADMAEGAHTLRVIATDEAGRANEQSVQITLQHGAAGVEEYPAKIDSWYAVNGDSGVSGVFLEECQSAQINFAFRPILFRFVAGLYFGQKVFYDP
jgi:hypothetical protein